MFIFSSDILQLLTGFFEFCATFEFESMIICPRIGRPLSRDAATGGQLPPELSSLTPFLGDTTSGSGSGGGLQIDKPICLQDPFELSFSATKNLSAKVLASFRGYMTVAAGVCQGLAEPVDKRPPGMRKMMREGWVIAIAIGIEKNKSKTCKV